ncbi:ABC transporter permease subunit [Nonomuraea sp. NN258]|nr:ABC transporter permease subunit [Nonomuraea antri]
MASEWLKLRSVSSTYYALGFAAMTVVLGAVWTLYVSGLAEERGITRAAAPEVGFLPLVQMSLAVLGVLAFTSEQVNGMIRTSLTVVPRRGTLLLAKAAVVGAVTLGASTAILVCTYAVSRLIAGDRPLGFNASPLADDLPMLGGSILSVTVLALVGLGFGAAVRSTAAGITGVVGLLFVLPGLVVYLPEPWNFRVGALLLTNLVPQIADDHISRRLGAGVLSPAAAVAVLIAYAVVALAVGFAVLRRRDA